MQPAQPNYADRYQRMMRKLKGASYREALPSTIRGPQQGEPAEPREESRPLRESARSVKDQVLSEKELRTWTKAQLYERAKDLAVPAPSRLKKEGLVQAVAEAMRERAARKRKKATRPRRRQGSSWIGAPLSAFCQ